MIAMGIYIQILVLHAMFASKKIKDMQPLLNMMEIIGVLSQEVSGIQLDLIFIQYQKSSILEIMEEIGLVMICHHVS